ncbi:DctM1 [Desulforapulum autotrophicum HRM2]|uniref:DctM1 n=1 Tax=Desulforapulum autotrophicum (strain ATCC 43914 / DSM 3382 / VKM B-1955 / HRM2) TaxID=177437 RepID=C0QGG2_DESAH|nr:TRAP transporter large permease [Desulforapulum autotrophicum]ACN13437.1 DctM1 [Desulforapulum autotrophicum HRM2]
MSVTAILFLTFVVLLFMGAPITLSLGAAAMAGMIASGKPLEGLVEIAYTSVNSFPIMALPAFILSGALMESAGISRRLVAVAESLAGPFTGGMAASTILSCLFFGAISGSGPATTAAVGMLMIPAMVRHGYGKGYAGAVTSSSGGLGVVIPPSIPMVIYGVSASQSIADLFVAGFFPGILLCGGLMTMNYIRSKQKKYEGDGNVISATKIAKTIKDGFWALLTPVIILGGIYTGFFTPTEAAIVSIFYTLFVGIFIYKEIKLTGVMKALESTTWLTGRVLIIMFTALAFGQLLTLNKVPDLIAQGLMDLTGNLYLIWVLVIFFLLFMGMFMETLATIMLVTPVLLPVMISLGVDPIHFGVVLVCCCEIGFATPPLGENMFIASGVANTTLEDISVNALPFVFVSILVVFLIAYIPGLTLWLPRVLGALMN